MNLTRIASLPIIMTALILMGAGCITVSTGDAAGDGGGMFRSTDAGDTWMHKVAVPTVNGELRSIGGVDVVTITQDPQDPKALYMGTVENGLYYSYDGGEAWFQPAQLRRGRIEAVAVDPKDKCTVYATTENRIVKSTDCSRTYETVYLDARTTQRMTAIVVDHFDPRIVWVGNATGDVLKSEDGGRSWAPVHTFRSGVMRLAMMADDSRRVYAGTEKTGVWRTDDAGANWLDLRERYKQFSDTADLFDMAIGVSDPAVIVLATKRGLLRSTDRGDTWESLALLTPESEALIHSVAVDPKDPARIYYGTSTTFYRSENGGVNWVPKQLPSARAATVLMVDKADQKSLYMGVMKLKKESAL